MVKANLTLFVYDKETFFSHLKKKILALMRMARTIKIGFTAFVHIKFI